MSVAQEVPRIACIVANADTGRVLGMRDFPGGGVLILAEKGWFVARAGDLPGDSNQFSVPDATTEAEIAPESACAGLSGQPVQHCPIMPVECRLR